MSETRASEELLAAPLPQMIEDLGLAVATANKQLAKVEGLDFTYTIHEAEIEIKVAISVEKRTDTKTELGANVWAFNVNASYARTYGFKEDASSRILLKLSAKPRQAPASAPAPAPAPAPAAG